MPTPQSRALQAEEAGTLARASDTGPFVINLCSSTTPMALTQPEAPELKRFTFFMSRRREDGRERFRLHMGYFVTAAEADEWLNVVREIFPGAWVGEAPGKRLRERQAANAQAAAAATARPPAAIVSAPEARRSVTRPTAPPPAARTVSAAAKGAIPANVPTVHPANRTPGATQPRSATRAPVAPRTAPAARGSNVREVLAALGTEQPRDNRLAAARPAMRPQAPARPAPVATRAVAARPAAVAPPASAARPAPATRPAAQPIARGAPAATATRQPAISDTQVLRILEQRADRTESRTMDEAQSSIALLKPEDTGTRRALREAVNDNQLVSFAVQLQWSVQPIELMKVPPLAIFSAYTLYTVEGSREGRKWFGLRLGFFSDAHSAKQVAYYVRSEFTTVAVVPVSPQERTRATEERRQAPALAKPIPVKGSAADEFKLIDDEPAPAPVPAPQKPVTRAASPLPAKSRPASRQSATRASARVQARAKSNPQTLEETLEILGASQLEIDQGRGELLNDTGVRHLKVEVRKNTAFTRLLDRLTERVTKT